LIEGSTRSKATITFKRVNWGWSGQYKDKSYYYCIFKTKLGNQLGKAQVTSREGQHGLTCTNVWIKMVITIVFKSDSGVDPRQGSSHELRGSTRLTQNFYFFSKIVNEFLTHVLSRVDLSFWLRQVESILPLFFLKPGPV
jgi:hypothetical protein